MLYSNYSAIGTAELSVAPNSARIASNGVCLQIPFDMRSVIPAICGHSFFKYFYGCKVNVLNRYLGRQTVFFC